LKLYRAVFYKVLVTDQLLPSEVFPTVDSILEYLADPEVQQEFIKYYVSTLDNQRRGIVKNLLVAAKVDIRILKVGRESEGGGGREGGRRDKTKFE